MGSASTATLQQNSDSRQRSKSSASSKLGSWILARDSLQIREAPEDDCDLAGVSQSFCEEYVRDDEGGLHLSFLQQQDMLILQQRSVQAMCPPATPDDGGFAANGPAPARACIAFDPSAAAGPATVSVRAATTPPFVQPRLHLAAEPQPPPLVAPQPPSFVPPPPLLFFQLKRLRLRGPSQL
ncbi:hypothetical protein AAC387_Pa09g1174 [Persea americana]